MEMLSYREQSRLTLTYIYSNKSIYRTCTNKFSQLFLSRSWEQPEQCDIRHAEKLSNLVPALIEVTSIYITLIQKIILSYNGHELFQVIKKMSKKTHWCNKWKNNETYFKIERCCVDKHDCVLTSTPNTARNGRHTRHVRACVVDVYRLRWRQVPNTWQQVTFVYAQLATA